MRIRLIAAGVLAAVLCVGSAVPAGATPVAPATNASASATADGAEGAGADVEFPLDPADVVAEGDDWAVYATSGGWIVTKTPADLPVRSAAPVLWADHVDLGPARQAPDGATLYVTTADPRAASASDVLVGWSGEGDPAAPATAGVEVAAKPALDVPTSSDPLTPGPYAVARADYDLGDEAVALDGLGGAKSEVRAAVYLPEGAAGERPVAVFLHGQHSVCSTPDDEYVGGVWPCPAGDIEIPSYLGYGTAAEALASNGYVVVSISANAINAIGGRHSNDQGQRARAELILDHLSLLRQADAGEADGLDPRLTGALDLGHVTLMGHSRGGEAVVRAALLNNGLDDPFGIQGVMPLAATDFQREVLPDVPFATVLPYCDGDLAGLEGQQYLDDSRYAPGDVLRASVLVMGANHNRFNSVWTPETYPYLSSDDWLPQPGDEDLHPYAAVDTVCGPDATSRLSAAEQDAAGAAYIAAFVRLTAGAERQFLPMFDGSDAKPPSAGRADIRVSAIYPASARTDVDTFADASAPPVLTITGAATATLCEGARDIATATALPYCLGGASAERAGDWTATLYDFALPTTTALHLTYGAGGRIEVAAPEGGLDVSSAADLTFRVVPDESVAVSTSLDVTVTDGSGASATVAAGDYGTALDRLPSSLDDRLPKMVLQDVRIPVADLVGIDLGDVRSVSFASAEAGGAVLADLAFVDDPELGTPSVVGRPLAEMGDVRLDGKAGSTAWVPVVLSRPTTSAAGASIASLLSSTMATPGSGTAEAGDRCIAVPVTVAALDPAPSSGRITTLLSLGPLTGDAVTGAKTLGQLVVRDPAVRTDDLPYGTQGDACAEALATPVALSAPGTAERGSTISVAASGFRVGEGVRASVGDQVVATEVSADGSVALSLPIPADAALGATALTLTGAGSGRVAEAAVDVTAVPAPTPTPTVDAASGGTAQLAATGSGELWLPLALAALAFAAGAALRFRPRSPRR